MAKPTELVVRPREVTGKATKKLRSSGIIPANIFGRGKDSLAVQVETQAFNELRRGHHATGVIALRLPDAGRPETALIRHVQRDPRNGKVLHIDFLRVNLSDRITAKVSLHFVGVAPGVKAEGGVLLHLMDTLEVECAAGDIVESLELDISSMEHIDDIIHAKSIPLPANYILITDPEEAVVKITAPRIERVEEAVEVPAEGEATPAPASEAATGSAGA